MADAVAVEIATYFTTLASCRARVARWERLANLVEG
jgi:hypothetical protein